MPVGLITKDGTNDGTSPVGIAGLASILGSLEEIRQVPVNIPRSSPQALRREPIPTLVFRFVLQVAGHEKANLRDLDMQASWLPACVWHAILAADSGPLGR